MPPVSPTLWLPGLTIWGPVLPPLTLARTVTPSICRLNRRRWLWSGCTKIFSTVSVVSVKANEAIRVGLGPVPPAPATCVVNQKVRSSPGSRLRALYNSPQRSPKPPVWELVPLKIVFSPCGNLPSGSLECRPAQRIPGNTSLLSSSFVML